MNQEQLKIELLLSCDEDVILARQKIRAIAQEMGFSMLDQTRIVTAASELARNIVVHVGEGKVTVESLSPRKGMRIIFSDQGKGIANVDKAVQEGFSTVGSLGLGLSGARRLVDEFDITSNTGKGTTVTVVKWLPNN